MIMLICGEESIREIIPFPMNKNAMDVMMSAPAAVEKKQLDDVPDVFSNFALRVTQGNRVSKVEAAFNPFRRY